MAIPPVVLEFMARGLPDVQRAFRTIAETATRSERSTTSAVARGRSDKEREYRKLVSEVEKLQKQEVAAITRAEKLKIQSAEREAKMRVRSMISADREVQRIMQGQTRAFEREEQAKTRAAGRWVKQREAEEARSAKRAGAARERLARGLVGAAGAGVRSAVQAVAGGARALANLGGGFDVADAVQSRMKAQGTAADIANAGYLPGDEKNGTRRSSGEILSAATAAGAPMGLSQQETLGGLGAFTGKSGDLSMGLKILPQLAELARATGSDFEDLSSAAAEVFNSDTTQSAEQLAESMRMLAGQGKLGAVEIKDAATQAAKVTATASLFEGSRSGNLAVLGAMGQEAKLRGGATSAAEAMTSVARFGSDVAKGTDKFKALGIETKGAGGTLRGPEAIIKDSLTATKGDVSQISHLYGERSSRAVLGFADVYRKAGGGSGDPKKEAAAMAAVTKEFDRLKKAQITEVEQKESAARRMKEVDMLWTKAMLELREVAASALIPTLIRLVPQIEKSIPIFAELFAKGAALAEWFAANPFEGLGAIIAVKMGEQLVAAGMGKLIEKALSTTLGGAAGITIASAAIAIELGKIAIDKTYEEEDKKKENIRGDELKGEEISRKIASGKATPEDIQEAWQIKKRLAGDVDWQKKNKDDPGLLKKGGAALYGMVDEQGAKDAASTEKAALEGGIKSTEDTLKKLTDALNRNTEATNKNTPAGAAPGAPKPSGKPIQPSGQP